MLEIHEDKYLELFLMKCGFSGVQHKQHETDFNLFLLLGKCLEFLFYFIFILPPAFILVSRHLLIKKGEKKSNLKSCELCMITLNILGRESFVFFILHPELSQRNLSPFLFCP